MKNHSHGFFDICCWLLVVGYGLQKVQRFFYSSYDMQTFIGTFGEYQNPKNLQNLFMLVNSYQVLLFLNL